MIRAAVALTIVVVSTCGCAEGPVHIHTSVAECARDGQLDAETCADLFTDAMDVYERNARRFATLSACVAAIDGSCDIVQRRLARTGQTRQHLCVRVSDGQYYARPAAYYVMTGASPRAWAISPLRDGRRGRRRLVDLLLTSH